MAIASIEEFAVKTEVPSWARTAEWNDVPVQLRRRAFFSAGIEDARVLSDDRNAVAKLLQSASKDGKLYRRDTAITELKQLAEQRGLDTGSGNYDLTNPAAEQRIALVVDVNRAQAQGYARFKRSSSGGALLAFPCQELLRVRDSKVKRDWTNRWTALQGKLTNGRMIALKSDTIWAALSRFGTPYPPFDFNSGMGIRDISRREAIALGVMTADQTQPDPVADFNADTEVSTAGIHPDLLDNLKNAFGSTVKFDGDRARMNV